jgi:GNAT superfamily N-acetyltransferase
VTSAGVAAVDRNLRCSFGALASNRPNADVREISGLAIASAGCAFQMFNAAFLAGAVESQRDLERRLAAAQVHFNVRGLGWSFWACEGLIEGHLRGRAARLFQRAGLQRAAELPGMIAPALEPPRRSLPPVDIRRVGSESERRAFCDVGAACFHVPVTWFREIFLWDAVWRSSLAGYVGYVSGEPVVTAATYCDGATIGVYNVGTLPGHRRQGLAEALVRHALAEARRATGLTQTILQSTELGFRLYEAMGYRTVTTVSVYAS